MRLLIGLLALFVYLSISFLPQEENRAPQMARSLGKKNGPQKNGLLFFVSINRPWDF